MEYLQDTSMPLVIVKLKLYSYCSCLSYTSRGCHGSSAYGTGTTMTNFPSVLYIMCVVIAANQSYLVARIQLIVQPKRFTTSYLKHPHTCPTLTNHLLVCIIPSGWGCTPILALTFISQEDFEISVVVPLYLIIL